MMRLNKKHCLIFLIVFFIFGLVRTAKAEVIFSEIAWMGNSENTNAEWFEVYNNSSESKDISGWEISGLLSINISPGTIIPAHGYFVFGRQPVTGTYTYIPNFTQDYTYKGTLSNSGGSLYLKDSNGNLSSEVTYDGKIGDNETKQTMQWDGSKWITADPTPKEALPGSSNGNTDTDLESEVNNLFSSSEPEKEYKIITNIITPKIVTAGMPFMIDHQTSGRHKEKVILGKFVWNFGDGMIKEVGTSLPFEYIYQYPGDYVLTLSFYDSILNSVPDATDRITIKVVGSGVNISSVGTISDPFIELNNNSNYEIALHKWVIRGSTHAFVMPEGMIILPNKKLKLSPKVTGFDYSDLSNITITDETGQILAMYPNTTKPVSSNSFYKVLSNSQTKSNPKENPEIIDLNDLTASAENSNTNNLNFKSLAWIGMIGIIIVGILTIILIRQKNYPDYVEKELSEEDMTITE